MRETSQGTLAAAIFADAGSDCHRLTSETKGAGTEMDLSLIYELETADTSEEGVRRVFQECLEQVQLADSLGYHSVWFTEHHFLERFSYSSAPEVFLPFLAAHTKNIRLGHGIVLLPFNINHPLRVAERIATLDIVSNGRANFGGGRAISESELSAFGVDPDATRPQWEESLRMLPEMWTQDTFSWDSPTMKVPERAVIPKPVQKPHPPMFVACTQPASIEFAADNGIGVLGFGIGIEGSNSYVELYRERIKNCKPLGKQITNKFSLFVMALCCDTDEEALRLRGPDMRAYSDQVRQLFAPWIDGKAPSTYKWFMEFSKQNYELMQNTSMEDIVAAGGAAIGSPDTCVKVLQHLADAGVDEVMLFLQSYTTPHKAILRSIELFAKEVMPRVKVPAKV
jgi:alkanesulfonate monooxygenase SsuD/methylene tetrahydromethanopterin reductase-like flavin-dependent oxidoreductase (luciferase family)